MRKIIIMGAGGRDFHNFNTVFRDDPETEVVAFTATQIPGIDDRRYPASLAGPRYPDGIPIRPEHELADLIKREWADEVVLAYSDLSHEEVMHKASTVLAAGADFTLLGPKATMLESEKPVVAVCAVRTGQRQEPDEPQGRPHPARCRAQGRARPASDALRRPRGDARAALRDDRGDRRQRTRRSRSARSSSSRSRWAWSCMPGSTTRRSCGRPRKRRTSSSGTAATTTCRSSSRACTSSSPIRSAQGTSSATTRARRTCAWPTSSSSTKSTRPRRTMSSRCSPTSRRSTRWRESSSRSHRRSWSTAPTCSGARVLVVEDGPTLTHGEMPFGAGLVAARNAGAGTIVDPRPFAVGSIKETLDKWPQLTSVLPTMGYDDEQLAELEADDQRRRVRRRRHRNADRPRPTDHSKHPIRHVRYELEELGDADADRGAGADPGREAGARRRAVSDEDERGPCSAAAPAPSVLLPRRIRPRSDAPPGAGRMLKAKKGGCSAQLDAFRRLGLDERDDGLLARS